MKLNNFLSVLRETPDAQRGATPPATEPAAGATPPASPVPPLAPAATETPAVTTPPVASEGPDLSFIPTDYHVDGKPDLAKFTEHYQELVAADARARERTASVPEGEYDFALPPDMKFEGLDLPEGFSVQVDAEDPDFKLLYGELGGILRELGAPPEASGKVAGLLAKYEAIKYSRDFAALKADAKTLGTPEQAQARIGSVERLLQARLPADQAEALKGITQNAKALRALETLLGPASATPTPVPAAVDVENMTPMERLTLANKSAGQKAR